MTARKESMRTGRKTTEFWITLACILAGAALIALEKEEAGGALIAASGISYTLGRVAVKRNGGMILLALLLGCSTLSPWIETSEIIDVTRHIASRHDSYFENDEDALIESAALLYYLEINPSVSRETLSPLMMPVLDRHDDAVKKDETLTDFERRIYLRSAAILREIIGGVPVD